MNNVFNLKLRNNSDMEKTNLLEFDKYESESETILEHYFQMGSLKENERNRKSMK